MSITCMDCGAELTLPENSIVGEIIGCPDCGLDFVIVENESGLLSLQELAGLGPVLHTYITDPVLNRSLVPRTVWQDGIFE